MEQRSSEDDFPALYSIYMCTLHRNPLEGAVEEVSDGPSSCLEVMVRILGREADVFQATWALLYQMVAAAP